LQTLLPFDHLHRKHIKAKRKVHHNKNKKNYELDQPLQLNNACHPETAHALGNMLP
jgi:hypothetical protein